MKQKVFLKQRTRLEHDLTWFWKG